MQNRRLVSSVIIVCVFWWLVLSGWAVWLRPIPQWSDSFARIPSLFAIVFGSAVVAAGIAGALDSSRQLLGLRSLRGHHFRGLTSTIGSLPAFLEPKPRQRRWLKVKKGNFSDWLALPPDTTVQRHLTDGAFQTQFATAFPALARSIQAAPPEMIALGPYQALGRAIYETIGHRKVAHVPASSIESGHGGASLIVHSVNVANQIMETARTFRFEGIKNRKGAVIEAPALPDYQLNPQDPLIPLAGLAHDIGKLDTIVRDPDRKDRWLSLEGHDEAGGRILARIPEFWALPSVDRNALLLAVSYYHHPLSAPKSVGDRCRALMALLMAADIEASFAENGDVTGEYLDDMPDEENEFPPSNKLIDALYLLFSQAGRINGKDKDFTVGYKRGRFLYLKDQELREAISHRFNSTSLKDLSAGDGTFMLTRKITQLLYENELLHYIEGGMKYSSTRAIFKVDFFAPPKGDDEPKWLFMKSCIIVRLDTGRLPNVEKIPDSQMIPKIIGPQYGENSAHDKKAGPASYEPPSEEWADRSIDEIVGDQFTPTKTVEPEGDREGAAGGVEESEHRVMGADRTAARGDVANDPQGTEGGHQSDPKGPPTGVPPVASSTDTAARQERDPSRDAGQDRIVQPPTHRTTAPPSGPDVYAFNDECLGGSTRRLVTDFMRQTTPSTVDIHDMSSITTLFSAPIIVVEAILRDFGAPDRLPDPTTDNQAKPAGFAARLKLLKNIMPGNLYGILHEMNRQRNVIMHDPGGISADKRILARLEIPGGHLHRTKTQIILLIDFVTKHQKEVWRIFQAAAGNPPSERPEPDRTPPDDISPDDRTVSLAPEARAQPDPANPPPSPATPPIVMRERLTGTDRLLQAAKLEATARERPSDGDAGSVGDEEGGETGSRYEDGDLWDRARQTVIHCRDATYSVLSQRLAAGGEAASHPAYDAITITEVDGDQIATIGLKELQIIRANNPWPHYLTMILDRQSAGAPIPKWITVSPDRSREDMPLRLHLHLTRMTRQLAAGITDDAGSGRLQGRTR
ncbi:MAG: hypothetical protein PHZ23_15100 [Acidiphilium sp.]|nr:hypothetical protein [Acidiphilium sp.]